MKTLKKKKKKNGILVHFVTLFPAEEEPVAPRPSQWAGSMWAARPLWLPGPFAAASPEGFTFCQERPASLLSLPFLFFSFLSFFFLPNIYFILFFYLFFNFPFSLFSFLFSSLMFHFSIILFFLFLVVFVFLICFFLSFFVFFSHFHFHFFPQFHAQARFVLSPATTFNEGAAAPTPVGFLLLLLVFSWCFVPPQGPWCPSRGVGRGARHGLGSTKPQGRHEGSCYPGRAGKS